MIPHRSIPHESISESHKFQRQAFENRTTFAKRFPLAHYTATITDTLNEWNESCLFEIRNAVVNHTDASVIVSGLLYRMDDRYDAVGRWLGYHNEVFDGEVIGVYGDDDDLQFLGILTNGKDKGISILINDPIRG